MDGIITPTIPPIHNPAHSKIRLNVIKTNQTPHRKRAGFVVKEEFDMSDSKNFYNEICELKKIYLGWDANLPKQKKHKVTKDNFMLYMQNAKELLEYWTPRIGAPVVGNFHYIFQNLEFEEDICLIGTQTYKHAADVSQGEALNFNNCYFKKSLEVDMPIFVEGCSIDTLVLRNYEVNKVYVISICENTHLKLLWANNLRISKGYLVISDSQIDGLNLYDTQIDNVTFREVRFCERHTTERGNLNFNKTVFQGAVKFIGCKFNKSPEFHGAILNSDTSFLNCKFMGMESDGAERDYAVLKQHMRGISADMEAEMFQGLETQSRIRRYKRDGLIFKEGNLIEYSAATFMQGFNNFGQNLVRPLYWIFGFIFLLAFFNFGLLHFDINMLAIDQEKIPAWINDPLLGYWGLENLQYALIYSVRHGLGPLGLFFDTNGIQAANGFSKTLAFLQLFLSSLMLYLYVMQIRRRFRM
jgi:uncharacterized protein YjbI with pentapeptide repeats